MHPNKTIIEQGVAIIETARTQASELMQTALPHVFTGLDARLKQAIGFLSGVGGLTMDAAQNVSAFPTLAEIAEAEGIPMRKPAATADTTPSADEKEAFRSSVRLFAESIPNMTDDRILDVLHLPQGDKILRGAAKIAGLQDYLEAELDVAFVTRIRKALDEAAETQRKQEAFRAGETVPQTKTPTTELEISEPAAEPVIDTPTAVTSADAEVSVTEQTLTENPEMANLGAAVGDEVAYQNTETDTPEATEAAKAPAKTSGKKK